MKTTSPWKSSHAQFPQIAKDSHFDVVVVGAGITGLTAAYLLKQSGKRVCVLERDRLGTGETGMTTAHLTYQTDLRISELARAFGEEGAAQTLRGGQAAMDLIEANVRQRQISCEFRRVPGYLHAPLGGSADCTESLQEDAALAQKLGFPVRFLSSAPYFQCPGISFPDQAKFDPLKYISALAALVDGEGSEVHEHSEVGEVQEEPYRLGVGKQTIQADYLVIATHVPLVGASGLVKATLFQTKLYPYTSYVVGAQVRKGLLPEACFWDTSDPYHYLRVEAAEKNDYVIFGGEDHKTGQEADTVGRFESLQAMLHELIPEATIDRRWSGQVIETNDGLPYIGETASGQFVATGFSGNGMTFGTLAGMMACDFVMERKNPWTDLFAIDRKTIRGGAWDYLTENVDFPYYFLKDRLFGERAKSIDEVLPGEGKILTLDGQRVACSRDKKGEVLTVSAHCTHMGCLVRWNAAELSWDCPCHGSRFAPDGAVLGGPAETPLEPVSAPANSEK